MRPSLVVMLAAAAVSAGTARADVAGFARSDARATVLAFESRLGRTSLSLRDAVTLARVGRRLAVAHGPESWARSPGGRYLALADSRDGLTTVDLRTMRVEWRLPRGILVRALAWVTPRRLLLVEHGAVLLVDPVARRVVGRAAYEGEVLQVEQTRVGLVVLASAGNGRVEPARLVVVGPGLRIRTVVLPDVLAGVDGGNDNAGPFRGAWPALAFDREGERAFVAGGDRVVAVDLRTLAQTITQPSRTPQKVAAGPVRTAAWLGTTLAVAGYDLAVSADPAGEEALEGTVYGLRYLRDGGMLLIDPAATEVRAAGALALAYGARWWIRPASAGSGLAAYDAAGVLRWRALAGVAVDSVTVVGGRVYVQAAGSLPVVDIATGRVLSQPRVPPGLWVLAG
jgi:hypothetical protein